jgi:hypothetical protein
MGCATSVPTYELRLPLERDKAAQALQKALRLEGLELATVDPARGVLATTWRDSGYEVSVGTIGDDMPDLADVYRRYRVLLIEQGGATRAIVQVDGRRCLRNVRVDEAGILQQCHDSRDLDETVLTHDFSQLAHRLARDTGSTATVVREEPRADLAYRR